MSNKLKITFGIVTIIMVLVLCYLIMNDPSNLRKRELVKLDKLKELYKELAIFENEEAARKPKIQMLDSLLNKEYLFSSEEKKANELMQELGYDCPAAAVLNKYADVIEIDLDKLKMYKSLKKKYLENEINNILKRSSFDEDSIATIKENAFAEHEIKEEPNFKIPPYSVTSPSSWDNSVTYYPTANMIYEYDEEKDFTIKYELLRYGKNNPIFYVYTHYSSVEPKHRPHGYIFYRSIELRSKDIWFTIYTDYPDKKSSLGKNYSVNEWYEFRVKNKDLYKYISLVKSDTVMVKFNGKTFSYTYTMPKEQLEGLRTIVNLYHELWEE